MVIQFYEIKLLAVFFVALSWQYSTVRASNEVRGSREDRVGNHENPLPPPPPPPPRSLLRPPTLPPPPQPPIDKPPPPEKFDKASIDQFPPTTEARAPTTSTPVNPSCPCVKKPGTNTCMVYDSRFQAISVEEAIVHFPDLTLRKVGRDEDVLLKKTIIASSIASFKGNSTGDKTQPSSGSGDPPSGGLCMDEECKACSNALIHRLQVNGMLNSDDAIEVRKKLDVSTDSKIDCSKYNVKLGSEKSYNIRRKPTLSVNANIDGGLWLNGKETPRITYIVDELSKDGLNNWNSSHVSVDNVNNVDEVPDRPQMDVPIRIKREADNSSILSRIVGERFKIGCIKRGDPMDKTSDWVSLCDCCWVWRKLPTDHFPQYINELICDSDQKCLSGWGTCQQQYRNVDILKNLNTNGKEDWHAVVLESSNFCECAVKSGSALHNFVIS